ncbi:MAG: enoyl-CoA hydratase-related protein [Sneathiella sp.]
MAILNYEVKNHIALVTLNRPEARNALNPEMVVRLADAFKNARDDEDVRVIVLTGTGTTFCAGADLGTLIPIISGAKEPKDEWDQKVFEDRSLVFKSLLRDFDTEKPVIAAVQGHAIAGGLEILQGTDIRVAGPDLKFGVQEVKWAIFPGGGSTVRLPNQIPYAKAMELLLTGDLIKSEEALGLGFLNHVVPADQVLSKAMEIAEKIAANGPIAVKAIRASARACVGVEEKEALRMEIKFSNPVFKTQDAREGPRAFMEKRKPVYVGK